MSQKNNGSKQNPTTVIKCSFSNSVHKILEPNIDKKNSQRWKFKKELTEKEKIEMFDEIMSLHKTSSALLTKFQFEKREKRRIHKARVERGYNFNKKKNLEVSE